MDRRLTLFIALVMVLALALVASYGGAQETAPTPTPTSSARTESQATGGVVASAPTPALAPTATPTLAPPTATPTQPPAAEPRPTDTDRSEPRPTSTPSPEPTATQAPPVAEQSPPVRLVINTDAVKVDAPVEYVGLTPEGAMDVPKEWGNVAWYEPGTAPGEPGNSVMAGHFDTDNPASPCAVFCHLDKINVGDEVSVVDKAGGTIRFRVTKKEVYLADNAPLLEIFGPAEESRLNLITCDGTWDEASKSYDKRLVVFTERVQG